MKNELQLLAPDPNRDFEPLVDLLAKVFSGHHNYFDFIRMCGNQYMAPSHYDYRASRIGVLDDQIVSHYGVFDYTMRIGTARVRCGGIGVVATHGEYRKRGLMVKTAMASVDAMREEGYDFSLLFGIPNFYHQFGYVRAWPGGSYVVRTDVLPTEKPKHRLRKFKVVHRDDIARIYNREHARQTGSAVRPTYRGPLGGSPKDGRLWTNAQGKTVGYVMSNMGNHRLDVVETGGDMDEVLRVVGHLARRGACDEVSFATLHNDSPLARHLRTLDCRVETHYTANGGAMMTIVNLPSALKKMCGELSARLKGSALAQWRGDLLIQDPREKAMLHIEDGTVSVVDPGPTPHAIRDSGPLSKGIWLTRLLIGSDDPTEVIRTSSIRTRGDGKQLAEVLFPNQHPLLGVCDGF